MNILFKDVKIGFRESMSPYYWLGSYIIQKAIKEEKCSYTEYLSGNISPLDPGDIVKTLEDLGFKKVQSNFNVKAKRLGERPANLFRLDENIVLLNIYSEDDAAINFIGNDLSVCEKIISTFKDVFKTSIPKGRIYMLAMGKQGPNLTLLGSGGVDLKLGNYNQSVANGMNHVIEDLNSTSPCGRLVILNGPPGVGKTFLTRGILNSVEKSMFVLVPPNLIEALAEPNFVKAIIENKGSLEKDTPTILIAEDADRCLERRAGDNMSAISSLLNITDGIFGSLIDLRVICTTNARSVDIDDAILRPGRLCKHIEVGKLTPDIAASVFNRLTKKDKKFEKETDLATVYRIARDEGWVPDKIENKTLGFKPMSKYGDGYRTEDDFDY
ncbi:MAG: ATP-binding protein [Elusimicrobia bacterium]|nr:ATP-binding protein [Elusimicrobiota bacterium]